MAISNHDTPAHRFYRDVIGHLSERGAPFLVGGAYALQWITGISRPSKDLDLFIRKRDCEPILDIIRAGGYQAEITFDHWLAKTSDGQNLIDLVFNAGNGAVPVDDLWFEHAIDAEVLGMPVRICPIEETIWSKSYIMERERYDGADVAHLLRARGAELDWHRVLGRFGSHWRVLLSHLILFGFIYPAERAAIPQWVLGELLRRCEKESDAWPAAGEVCQGTLLSRSQYLVDIEEWHYADARLLAPGTMTSEQVETWTAAGR